MRQKEYSLLHNWNTIIISVMVVSILTLCVLYLPGIRDFDSTILNAIRRALSPFPAHIAAFISEFGRAQHLLWPQITVCSVLVSHQKYLKAFIFVLMVQMTYFTTGLIKDFVCRERPSNCYSGYSFPSGHSSTTMCFCGILIYLILKYVRNDLLRYTLAACAGLYIIIVALSRMMLNVHFPTDILSGLFLGLIFVNLYIILDKTLN